MKTLPAFEPAWWLKHAHLQTIWSEVMRPRVDLSLTHEKFELADGDFLELSWARGKRPAIVIIVHGLGGSVNSPYVRGMIKALNAYDFSSVALHLRGCGREPNRHATVFHGGHTCDVAEVISALKKKHPRHQIFVIGFSIGGNILLKYLGEYRERSLVDAAVAISVPFLIQETQRNLSRGFSNFYQQYLLTRLKFILLRKIVRTRCEGIDLWSVIIARNLQHFDNLVTAPLHGFKDAQDYYHQSSSHYYLRDIVTKTLIIHAKDDPFFPQSSLPKESDLSKTTSLMLTQSGGHVGFIGGGTPRNPDYWLENIVPQYLLNALPKTKTSRRKINRF